MDGFFTDQRCLQLVKAHGNVLDLERVAKKRFEQSGCKNRFTLQEGRDIGLLSRRSYIKTTKGNCFTSEEIKFVNSKKDKETLKKLPVPESLTEALSKEGLKYKRKYAPLKKFLDTVGKGMVVPLVISYAGKNEVRNLFSSGLYLSLEKQGGFYATKSRLYLEGKFAAYPTIFLLNDTFTFSPALIAEMRRLRLNSPFKQGEIRIIMVPLRVKKNFDINSSHANSLLIDRKKKEIFYFEPHGRVSKGKYIERQEDFVQKFIDYFKLKKYKNVEVEATCPWFGPQLREENYEKGTPQTAYCITWNHLFAYCKAKFPDLSEVEIHEAMLEGRTPTEIRDLVERFGAFAWDETKKAAKYQKYHKESPRLASFYGSKSPEGRSVAPVPITVKY